MADIQFTETLVDYDETSDDNQTRLRGLMEVTVYDGEETAELSIEGLDDDGPTYAKLLLSADELLALIVGASKALQSIRTGS